MTPSTNALTAYLATLAAIVILCLSAAYAVRTFHGGVEELAKLIAALAFIGAAITGLIGVIGTFRPKVPDQEKHP